MQVKMVDIIIIIAAVVIGYVARKIYVKRRDKHADR